MARVETIYLGLSSATFLAACLMLCGAWFQKTLEHHGLQLFVCGALLCLAIARVILSALDLHRITGENKRAPAALNI